MKLYEEHTILIEWHQLVHSSWEAGNGMQSEVYNGDHGNNDGVPRDRAVAIATVSFSKAINAQQKLNLAQFYT